MPAAQSTARWVLVTGATSGIGEACAVTLLGGGFSVFAGFRSKRDAARLRELGLVPISLDVTRLASIKAAAAIVKRRCGAGGLHGLVNNAGVTVSAPLEGVPLAEVRRLFEVNVFGAIAVTQAVLPLLRLAHGRIVNVSSLSALQTAPFLGAYGASKAALESLSDALRMELAPWGIEVCLIEPGPTASRIWEKSANSTDALRKAVPSKTRALYAEAWDRFDEVIRRAGLGAGPVARVCAAVLDALSAAEPSTRYPLDSGESAKLRTIPDRERDALLLQGWGLPGRR